jgi:hypothetical protein
MAWTNSAPLEGCCLGQGTLTPVSGSSMMRCKKALLSLIIAGLAPCAGARAQIGTMPNGAAQMQLDVLQAQQIQAQQREISRQNEMMALETRLRADDSITLIQRQSAQGATGGVVQPAPRMTTIPDAALAASRARVEAIGHKR